MSSDRLTLRLHDIVENIDRISHYLAGTNMEEFAQDGLRIDAVERCLQRISEAVIKIGPAAMAEISSRTRVEAVRGLGNLLRHAYDEVDVGVVWSTVQKSLPILREDCATALAGLA